MKKRTKNILVLLLVTVFSLSLLAGCAKTEQTGASTAIATKVAGRLFLSINPEIEIKYDYDGDVIEIEGVNADGQKIVPDDTKYKGEDVDDAIEALVKEIYKAGYFETTVAGNPKNIVIKLGERSEYPDDDFLEEIYESVHNALIEVGLTSDAVMLENKDLDSKGFISPDAARKIALAQAGITEADIVKEDLDLDDGKYEFEFVKDGIEYEIEVDAISGKVVEIDIDDRDDLDDDKDDNDDDDDDLDDDKDDVDDKDDDDDRDDDKYDDRDDDDDKYDDRDDDDDKYDDRDDDDKYDDRDDDDDDDRDDDKDDDKDDDDNDDDRDDDDDDDDKVITPKPTQKYDDDDDDDDKYENDDDDDDDHDDDDDDDDDDND